MIRGSIIIDSGVIAIVLAIVVEAIVEYSKSVINLFSSGNKKPAVLQCVAIAAAVGLSFAAGINIFELFGVTLRSPRLGMLLTGVIISRGANYLSDFIGRILAGKKMK